MSSWVRNITIAIATGAIVVGCSSSDMSTEPSPSSASFAKGGGGGGATVTPNPPAVPTVTISSTVQPSAVLADQPVNLFVVAISDAGNRKAPTLAVTAAPAGFALTSLVTVDGPHGGGPGYVEAQYAWTPSRAQIGSTAPITLTATSAAGTGSATIIFGPVQDAPSALTGLSAVSTGDHIEARWNASANGVGAITYTVEACYRNANIRAVASTCDVVATTPATEVLDLPAINPSPTVAPAGGIATYTTLLVTPVDAAGHAGLIGSAIVQGAP